MAVSKRLRYEVFRRDNFACRYCGASAPDVQLTTDHVIPVTLGGKDEAANLVTACMPCNAGKSSSNPDAPLVDDVAQDAVRWSQAIRAAADQMLVDKAARDAECEQFREAWDRWTLTADGGATSSIPRDPGWRESVRSLRAAGLPMPILLDCIEIAMGRKNVRPEATFRYMCGVAWSKVTELQDRARGVTGSPAGDDQLDADDDAESAAIDNWCRIVLGQREPREVDSATRACRDYAGEDVPSPSGVLWFVINHIEQDRSALRDGLTELMRELPGGTGERLLREHEAFYRDRHGDGFNSATAVFTASQHATEYMALCRARQEMALMPGPERDAWVQQAKNENADFAEHLTDVYYVTEAARMAREFHTVARPEAVG